MPEPAEMIMARLGAFNLALQHQVLEKMYAVQEAKQDRAKNRKARNELRQMLIYLFYRGVITAEEVEILQHYRPQRHVPK